MTAALLAVKGMSVIPDPASGVVCTVAVADPSCPVLSNDDIAHKDGDEITVTNITVPTEGATIADPGPYTVAMVSSAELDYTQDIPLLKEGDESETLNATPQIPNPGGDPTDYPVSFICIVDDAGQAVVLIQ
jgi:hypothetical protein